ncbi:VanZ family protein [Brasilonema octagenarum UFV-E1]|uniref:VanZ family protein n=1 Tax=Brasilonema sennae CENA114 TaxID=415709 RepID=A0A856M9I0_9CYAN|nr:VanZ family protein [Brasilonema sennae]QDL06659.1 VanZ family protein [Brasilonema sennae CENA114]QDL13027.1 VanZ family protein [Brasilonema octagenarum UFV-E1]
MILVIFSILVVLIATLFPFNFSFPDSLSPQLILASFDNTSSFGDLVNNILLFMPLGFGLTALSQRKMMKLMSVFLIVILISAGLSSIVEFLQVFLPSRTPTPTDIVNNTTGGFVGIICFYLWHSQHFIYIWSRVENSRVGNSITKITLLFSGYILLSFLISILWQNSIELSNWSLNYPLMLGNEQTGNRPWQGYISEMHIADKAIAKSDISRLLNSENDFDTIRNYLIASYQLINNTSYQDRTGQLPELSPQGQLPNIADEKGVALSSSHWLKTRTPATYLNKRIRESSQFTIMTTVATADRVQTGPARILSISSSTLHRNLTLGQQETNLDLRIRTPITGANAADLKFSVPNFFTDTNPHKIVITYSQANIQVYIDKLQNFYSFNLLELVPKEQKIFYYALTFIPLGICLTLLTIRKNKKLSFYRFLLFSGILLPSLIVERILVINTGKSISLKNILLGMFFTGVTMLILRLRASALLKKKP